MASLTDIISLPSPERVSLRCPIFSLHATPPSSLPASHVAVGGDRIAFCHPAYPDSENVLFSLPYLDRSNSAPPTVGVHHGTALLACCLIANNQPGCLVHCRTDSPENNLHYDDILTEDRYYFYVTSPDVLACWPVCPSFDDWVFPLLPRTIIPANWYAAFDRYRVDETIPMGAPSEMTGAVAKRDSSCRLTGATDICETAYLVPVAKTAWFKRNALMKHNMNFGLLDNQLIHDIRNGIFLRQDLHTALDRHWYTFTVKNDKLVAHFLWFTTDLARHYHNREIAIIKDSRAEFFLARFALSIFPYVDVFAKRHPVQLTTVSIPAAIPTSAATPRPAKRRRNAVESPATAAPSIVPELDSEREEQEDLEVARMQFPSLLDPEKTDDEVQDVYDDIMFHPGYWKMSRLKKKWMQKHPAVGSSGEESGAEDRELGSESRLRRAVESFGS